MSKQPHDDDPTLTDGKVIDGEVIDGRIVDGDVVDGQIVGDDVTARLAALSLEIDEHPAALGEQLTATLHAIGSEVGEPPTELVDDALADAGRLRRRRYAVTAVAALAALGLSGTAVAASSWGSDGKADRLVASAPVQASPSAAPSPEVLPATAVPSSPAASPSASASASVSAVPAAPPARPGAGAPPVAAPRPAAALTVSYAGASDIGPQVGDPVTYTVAWKDGDGRFFATEANWGDDTSSAPGGAIERCSEVPSPRSGQQKFTHTWTRAGTFRAQLTVSTYDCTTYKLEKKSVPVTVIVTEKPKSPSSPEPSSPTPSSSTPTEPPSPTS